MISLYNKNETDFTHNGIVLSDLISCEIEEELNGKYILELEHTLDENGKWKYLQEETIIQADGQLFRIHDVERNLHSVSVLARHIFYDLLHNFLEDVRPTNLNGVAALNYILDNSQYEHRFIGSGDVEKVNTQYFIRKNIVESILGADSLVSRWNGEIERDRFNIRFKRRLGSNRGVKIYYGKNLLGLEVNINTDNMITRIMPQGNDELLLPEKYIDSKLINEYAFPYIKKIDFNIGVQEETDDQEEITEEEAIQLLRQAAKDYIEENKTDIPEVNIKADLLLLENTKEYKDFRPLEKIGLGDTVFISKNPLELEFESRIMKRRKDVLTGKNIFVEIGNVEQGISDTFNKIVEKVGEDIDINKSELEKAIDRATELLTNALGGHVLKRPGELLIMDHVDPYQAERIWRWNINGLGYSKNGLDGPFPLAMTIDGEIVADFITTGVLNAALVKAGILSSVDGSIHFNMENGEIQIGKNVIITQDSITVNHDDGSYSLMDKDGFKRFDGGTGKMYHHLVKHVHFKVGGDGQAPTITWIPLGTEFSHLDRRDFTVGLEISDSLQASSNEATIHRIVLTGAPGEVSRFRNGQWEYPVMGYTTYYSSKTDSRRYGDVAGVATVIA